MLLKQRRCLILLCCGQVHLRHFVKDTGTLSDDLVDTIPK
jgi:hypothetical protein